MEKKTNYGKIIAITLAVITAASAIAFVIYKLFVKDLAKCYCCEECDEDFLEENDSDDCECIECTPAEEAEAEEA